MCAVELGMNGAAPRGQDRTYSDEREKKMMTEEEKKAWGWSA